MPLQSPLKDCWHPVAFSYQVAEKPYATELLTQAIVIWRTSDGKTHAHRDRCVHRSSKLSNGVVINDSLRCPFHGWSYNVKGACIDIPQAPEMRIPPSACVPAYQCVERYGIIWVALVEPRYPLPVIAELESPDWRTVTIGPYTWDCDASRMFENLNDLSHFSWVHPGLVGDPDRPEVPIQNIKQDGHILYCNISRPDCANPKELPVFASDSTEKPMRYTNYQLQLPFTHIQHSNWGGSKGLVHLSVCQPHSIQKTTMYSLIARNYSFDEKIDREMQELERILFEQDRIVVEAQYPKQVPFKPGKEMLMKFDLIAATYRRAMREAGLDY